ncbi:hypothetical protein [Acinetobacter pittii]|uniref:hypothetical protein n=1 Tax=Acinetobacter pittii TaxID=48296 RepID=UPI001ABFA0DB|nr:hypothetical protein [Acinetobacter pittii]QDB82220.1 hypothetical protein APMS7_07450 [Acinetobacter pittii]
MQNVEKETSPIQTNTGAVLVLNQTPNIQAFKVQNTDPLIPIQLRVDNVTDYWALAIPVIVSIITSLISAYVTIKSVTNSNVKLVESQEKLQENSFKNDRKKELDILTSKNRQEWLNSLRTDIAEIITQSANIVHNLRATLQLVHKENEEKAEKQDSPDFSIFITSYQKVDALISKVELFLNSDKKDQSDLLDELNKLKSNLFDFCNTNLQPDTSFYAQGDKILNLKNLLTENIKNVSAITKKIIKQVWQKTKSGE